MCKSWIYSMEALLCIYLTFALFIVAQLISPIRCDQVEYKLVHTILKDYDPSIRPSQHHNSTLNVTFGLALTQLIDVDWIDHKLKWDPSLYNNIKSLHIPAEKLWKPDILLVNNADVWAKTSSISTNAIVKYNGNVTWLSTVIFKSSCSINVRYFPFDEQMCDMTFASWTFDGFFLDVSVNSNEGDITNYIKNGEWHLVKLTAVKNLKNYSCCDEPYPEICYRLIIRRRPLYYVFNLVFPCMLITLVAFLGFYLPPGSTDKVNIGITTLLSITVFLMLVAESMPPTSEQLPLLGIYYAVTIGIVSFSTSMAVVTLNINNRGTKGKRVPPMVKLIFFKYLTRIFRIELYNNDKLLKKKKKIYSEFYIEKKFSKSNKTKNCPNNNNNNRFPDVLVGSDVYDKCSLYEHQKSTSQQKHEILIEPYSGGVTSHHKTNFISKKKPTDNLILKSQPIYKHLDTATTIYSKPEILSFKMSNNQAIFTYQEKDYSDTNCGENLSSFPIDADNLCYQKSNHSTNHETYNGSGKPRKASRQSSLGDERDVKNESGEFINELEKLLSRQFDPLVKSVVKVIERNEKMSVEKEKYEAIQEEWSDVAMISDHILFYFFSVMTIVCCLIIFLNSPHTLPLSQW